MANARRLCTRAGFGESEPTRVYSGNRAIQVTAQRFRIAAACCTYAYAKGEGKKREDRMSAAEARDILRVPSALFT